ADGEAIGMVTVLATGPGTWEIPVFHEPSDTGAAPGPSSPGPLAADAEDPAPPKVFPPSHPPAARTEALRKIASIAQDPAFQDLIAKKRTDPPENPSPDPAAQPESAQSVYAAAGPLGSSVVAPASAAVPFEEVG